MSDVFYQLMRCDYNKLNSFVNNSNNLLPLSDNYDPNVVVESLFIQIRAAPGAKLNYQRLGWNCIWKKELQTKKKKVFTFHSFLLFWLNIYFFTFKTFNKCLIYEFICQITLIITITWGPHFQFFYKIYGFRRKVLS